MIEAVEATALALGVELLIANESDELARLWRDAGARLVSPELLGRVHWLPPRPETYVVGREPRAAAEASAELGCPVLLLPTASGRLAEIFSGLTQPRGLGRTVAVVSASGGAGVSTIAAGLALTASVAGSRAALVELAPHGGGLDLLLGAETERGARWPELAGAQGQLGDLAEVLIHVEGISVLAASREIPGAPELGATKTVLAALTRVMDVVVVDAGSRGNMEVDSILLVVAGDVRGVAAARALCAQQRLTPTGLIVRSGPGRTLAPSMVAEALDAPLLGTVREDLAVPRLAELGQLPTAAPARRFRKDLQHIWKALGEHA